MFDRFIVVIVSILVSAAISGTVTKIVAAKCLNDIDSYSKEYMEDFKKCVIEAISKHQ